MTPVYWESKMRALQEHGLISFTKPNEKNEWIARWGVTLVLNDGPIEMQPTATGMTPSACVCSLWDRYADYDKILQFFNTSLEDTGFVDTPLRKIRWNNRWDTAE